MKVVLTVYRNIYKMGLQILDMNLIKLDFTCYISKQVTLISKPVLNNLPFRKKYRKKEHHLCTNFNCVQTIALKTLESKIHVFLARFFFYLKIVLHVFDQF